MAINYAALTKRVRKLLADNGAAYDATRKGEVYRNGAEELVAPDKTFSVIGILTKFSLMELAGSTVQAGDMKFICVAPPTEELKIGDLVTINTMKWRVINPAPVAPKASTIVYLAQVRLA